MVAVARSIPALFIIFILSPRLVRADAVVETNGSVFLIQQVAACTGNCNGVSPEPALRGEADIKSELKQAAGPRHTPPELQSWIRRRPAPRRRGKKIATVVL